MPGDHEAIVDKVLERLCSAAARPQTDLKTTFYLMDAVTHCLNTAKALDRAGDHRNAEMLRFVVHDWMGIIRRGAPFDPPPYAALAMPVPRPLEKLLVGRRTRSGIAEDRHACA